MLNRTNVFLTGAGGSGVWNVHKPSVLRQIGMASCYSVESFVNKRVLE